MDSESIKNYYEPDFSGMNIKITLKPRQELMLNKLKPFMENKQARIFILKGYMLETGKIIITRIYKRTEI